MRRSLSPICRVSSHPTAASANSTCSSAPHVNAPAKRSIRRSVWDTTSRAIRLSIFAGRTVKRAISTALPLPARERLRSQKVHKPDQEEFALDYVVRFMAGGLVVSAFAILGDMLRPKRFGGIFVDVSSLSLEMRP